MSFTRGAMVLVGMTSLLVAACGGSSTEAPAAPVTKEHQLVKRGAATSARVDIGMTAGELEVRSGAKELLEGDFEYNVAVLKPVISYGVSNNEGVLKVSQGSASGNYENHWHVNLQESTPMQLTIGLGAGDANLVLGRLSIARLDVSLGAGDLVVDLRGAPTKSYVVNIKAGAGDTTIHVPATVGISASTTGIIGETNVSGLEKRDGKWVNARVSSPAVTIDLHVTHGIGDLRILAE
jgi:N-terminal domain of toast_rack, DUF2154